MKRRDSILSTMALDPLEPIAISVPDELWILILSHLRAQEQIRLASVVSQRWRGYLTHSVTCLETSSPQLTDNVLCRYPSLSHIYFESDNAFVSDAGLRALTNLRSLCCPPMGITDEGLASLTALTSLTSYHDRARLFIAPLTNLRTLKYWNGTLVESTLALHTNLTDLSVRECDRIYGLTHLTNLIALDVKNCDWITESSVSRLTQLRSLELDVYDRNTDNAISGLLNLQTLYLVIYEPGGITNAAMLGLTNLTFLSMDGNGTITNDAISMLTSLTGLELIYDGRITYRGIKSLTNLTYLNLYGNETVSDRALKRLTKLRHLDLTECELITDYGLKRLTSLTKLNLDCNKRITAEGISHLVNLTSMGLACNDAGISKDSLPKTLTNIVDFDCARYMPSLSHGVQLTDNVSVSSKY
jgi:hypothetical protein